MKLVVLKEDVIEKIGKRLDELEARISKLEGHLLQTSKSRRQVLTKNVKGPAGLIGKLIGEGFLGKPKTYRQVQNELEREGYYYQPQAIHNALTRDFMKKTGRLTRVKRDGQWNYVLKK